MVNLDIRTRYSGPTDTRGSRVTAYGNGRQLTIPYPYDSNDAHLYAASALLAAMGVTKFEVVSRREISRGYAFMVAL